MIPCYWIHYHGGPVRCRWDEQMVDRLISGRLKRPGWFPDVVHHETMEAFRRNPVTESCIVMFPAGDHDERDVARLNADLGRLKNPVIFVTSDEGSTFPVDKIVHPSATFFVMTPRSDHVYPPESFFIGEGDADAGVLVEPDPTIDKLTDIIFYGQGGHPRRDAMLAAFETWKGTKAASMLSWLVDETPGFLQGVPRETYLRYMAEAKVALCPAGTKTQDSFRVYEALTHGCVPILDNERNDGEAPHFWEMLGDHLPVKVPSVDHWQPDLLSALTYALGQWPKSAVRAHEWWHWHRRRLALHLSASLEESAYPSAAADQITVIMPTSPIPSHPSTAMIESTINSIRRYIDSEILIMVDGVREEQADREADYWEYVRRLMLVAERADNVTPVVSWTHVHQSGLMRRALDHVTTPFVFFVEHDCPLDGQPIDFEGILSTMNADGLNLMRFHHESRVLDDHADLFFEREPDPERTGAPYVRTMQWSQRPHIARTGFYKRLLDDFFGDGAKTMIEDVLHGVSEFAHRKQPPEDWRLAVYAPSEGGMRRSLHLDGRSDDPMYPMTFDYPGERPLGATTWDALMQFSGEMTITDPAAVKVLFGAPLKIGLIARANQRGIGIQTHEAFRHYPFDRTLVITIPDMRFPDDVSLYPDATVISLDTRAHMLSKGKVCRWMEGLDVVFSVETLYDWTVATWARDMNIRTVVQGNPEFYVHRRKTDQPHPDLWVWPTPWRPFDDMPEQRILPVPVPNDRPRIAAEPEDGKLVVLHVAGHRALADRNGTDTFMEAVSRIRRPCEIRVVGQDGQLPLPSRIPRHVDLVTSPTGVRDRWEMYEGVHVVCLPRRYGGNCLPVYEAMASGCAVMMPNIPPNDIWPIIPLDARQGRQLQVQAGFIATHNTVADSIAYTINILDEHRDRLMVRQNEARLWAHHNTWRALEHEYDEAFAVAIGAHPC